MNIPKAMLLVADSDETDMQPIFIREETIKVVSKFRYLGSIVTASGEIKMEVEDRVAHASRALEPCVGLFLEIRISLWRQVYNAVVLRVLLYQAVMFVYKRDTSNKIEIWCNRCL